MRKLYDQDRSYTKTIINQPNQRDRKYEPNQLLTHSMHCLHVLLRGTFDRDEAHRWSARRLADRLGITSVVLVSFDVGLYEPSDDE